MSSPFSVPLLALPTSTILVVWIVWLHDFNADLADKNPVAVFRSANAEQSVPLLLAATT